MAATKVGPYGCAQIVSLKRADHEELTVNRMQDSGVP